METSAAPIIVHELTPADIPSVQDITWRSWLSAYSPFIPVADLLEHFNQHYCNRALAAFLADPDCGGFIALRSGPAGYCKTQFNRQEGKFYIPSLYILPGCQGAGLGSLLLERASAFARAAGLHEVWLGVMEKNTDALAWYSRRGFVFVRQEPFRMGATEVAHRIGFKKID